ncbi:MAG: formylglycine-generating enzyme family protein [Bacteroidales bacterium]|nr:formylglycine-generating enzyme family protein [Bacteroidales bacterium]
MQHLEESRRQAEADEKKKKSRRTAIGVLGGLAGVVVLIVLIVSLVGNGSSRESYTTEEEKFEVVEEGSVKTFTVYGVSFKMVKVEGGTFTMGATSEQGSDAESNEEPTHRVTLSSYSIGQTEVTQALWQAVMGNNPSYFKGNDLPVENVSWKDCQDFIRKLNALTGKNFRLPTEAEWEYAARGGNKSQGYKYSGSNTLRDVAWFGQWNGETYDNGNSGEKTHPVATKQPNELELYDMSGNVCELCQDWFGNYSNRAQTLWNPTGPTSGFSRVFRGGSWNSRVRDCRLAHRDDYVPDNYPDFYDRFNFLGLRLVLSELIIEV